jgi:hypothetical protein
LGSLNVLDIVVTIKLLKSSFFASDLSSAATWLSSAFLMAFFFPVGELKAEETSPPLPPGETMSFQTTDQNPTPATPDPAEKSSSNLEVEPAPLNADPSPLPNATGDTGPYASSVDQPSLEVTGADTGPKPVRWVVTANINSMYDDNIFISSRDPESDVVFNLAPTIAVGLGDVRSEFRRLSLGTISPLVVDESYEPRTFLFFRYTPTVTIFFDHSNENVLNHDAAFEVRWNQAYLTVGSKTSFQTLSYANTDVGNRVDSTVFSQNLTALYDYSDRTSFEFNLNGFLRTFSGAGLLDSREVESLNWVNYRIGERTHVGFGFGVGYLGVTGEDSQFYQQILFRAQYSVTEKINLNASAGVERREFGNGNNRLDPVFGVGISYHPFDQTTIDLAASRSIENSVGVAGEDIVSTSINVDIRQRFFRRYYLGFKADYLNAEYIETSASRNFSRTDKVYSLSPYVRMEVTKTAAVMAGYASRHDDSSLSDFTFSENQVFLQVNLLF